MSCFAYGLMGGVVHNPSKDEMQSLLSSVGAADAEHPDVSLNTEDGWSLSYSKAKNIAFENVETGEGPWHMTNIQIDQALSLWLLLSSGHIEDVRANHGLRVMRAKSKNRPSAMAHRSNNSVERDGPKLHSWVPSACGSGRPSRQTLGFLANYDLDRSLPLHVSMGYRCISNMEGLPIRHQEKLKTC